MKYLKHIIDPSLTLMIVVIVATLLVVGFLTRNPGYDDGRPDTFEMMCDAYSC